MAQPDSKPFTLQNPTELALAFGNDKNRLLQAVYAGMQGRGTPIDLTSAWVAGNLIDESKVAKPPIQTVLAKTFDLPAPPAPPAGLGATPQGMQMAGGPGPQMAAPPQMIPPAPQGPVRMAVGGLTTLPIPDDMYDERTFAGGGIVAFADGRKVDARAERLKALMSVVRNPNASSEDRMAARAEINKMEGMGSGRTPGPGLADALAYTQDDLPFRQPVSSDASIYSPESGTPEARPPSDTLPPGFHGPLRPAYDYLKETIGLSPETRALRDGKPYVPEQTIREEFVDTGSQYSPGSSTSNTPALFGGRDYHGGPGEANKRPAWHGAGRRAVNAAADAPLRMPRSLNELDPEGKLSPLAGGLVTGTVGAVDLARDAGILGAKGLRGTAGAVKDVMGGMYDFAFTPRGKRSASPTPSNAKSDLGRVNMDGYDLNRSSPETQFNAILGGSPTPVATELDALLGRTETAPTRIPAPRGERGVVGGATRAPTTTEEETTPAAGTDTPNAMTLSALQALLNKEGELPEFQRTSAEELAARKNEDLWSTLAQIGFGAAAGDSPYALTNIGKGAAAAMPGMQASLKERRADERDERNREFDYLVKKAGIKGDNFKSAYTIFSSMEDREQRAYLEKLRIEAQKSENRLNREVQRRGQNITSAGQKIYEKHYNNMSEEDQRNVEYYANILFKAGKAKTIEEARAIVFYQLNPIPVRSSTNVGSLQDRILAGGNTGGKDGSFPGFKHLGMEPGGD